MKMQSKKDQEWNAYYDKVKEENGFKQCTPEKLKLDGKYTKLLKAFSELFGLEHEIAQSKTTFGLGIEVSITVKNKWYHSAIEVFKEGCVAYVSSMREYIQNAREDAIEELSEKILKGTFGEGRYIMSIKGGDCVTLYGEHVPRFELHSLPRTEEQLMIMLDLAGIDWNGMKLQLVHRQL